MSSLSPIGPVLRSAAGARKGYYLWRDALFRQAVEDVRDTFQLGRIEQGRFALTLFRALRDPANDALLKQFEDDDGATRALGRALLACGMFPRRSALEPAAQQARADALASAARSRWAGARTTPPNQSWAENRKVTLAVLERVAVMDERLSQLLQGSGGARPEVVAARHEQIVADLRRRLRSREFESPAADDISRFLRDDTWAAQVHDRATQGLADPAALGASLRAQLEQLCEVDGPDSSLHMRLSELVRLPDFGRIRARSRSTHDPVGRTLDRLVALAASAFGNALLVAGSWGAGKTQVCAETAAAAIDKGFLVVRVRGAASDATFEAAVCRSASHHLGMDFADVIALRVWLIEAGARCVFLCEDLDRELIRWNWRPSEVTGVLERSASGTCRWLLTADARYLDAVLNGPAVDVFRRQAVEPSPEAPTIQVGGWLDLDVSNVRDGLGLQILHDQRGKNWGDELEAVPWWSDEFAMEASLANNPLRAWLASDVGHESPAALLFASVGVLQERLWNELLESDRIADDEDLQVAVGALARAFAPGQPTAPLAKAREACDAHGISAESFQSKLRALQLAGLVVKEPAPVQSEAFSFPSVNVGIGWAEFWAKSIAEVALETSGEVVAQVAAWSAPENGLLGRSVAEELLLQGISEARASRDLNKVWRAHTQAREALLMSAPQMSAQAQAVVGRLAAKQLKDPSARELFTLMRFLRFGSAHGLALPQQYKVLQKHFRAIGSAGLGDYALLPLRRAVEAPPQRPFEYNALLEALVGVEEADVGAAAAFLAYQLLQLDLVDDRHDVCGQTNKVVHAFLSAVDDSMKASDAKPVGSRAIRETFAGRLIQLHARAVVEERGIDALTWFVSQDWYSTQRKVEKPATTAAWEPDMFEARRAAANIELGRLFRVAPGARNDFHESVRALLRGEVDRLDRDTAWETAFFLIRHTVQTEGPPRAVDRRFLPELASITNGPPSRRNPKYLRLAGETLALTDR
jgi:hypothetical protein